MMDTEGEPEELIPVQNVGGATGEMKDEHDEAEGERTLETLSHSPSEDTKQEKIFDDRIHLPEPEAVEEVRVPFLGLSSEHGGKEIRPDLNDSVEISRPLPPAPVSIMSLSTGSEESAAGEEKFVKIKSCEMESGSSKASSQSGKENLELEEQIQHLNEQIVGLKKDFKSKDEECNMIKLQLETVLLEKSVENQSISSMSNEMKSMKKELHTKEEQMDEIVIILDELLNQVNPQISNEFTKIPIPDNLDSNSVEGKINFLKIMPLVFQNLIQDLKQKQSSLDSVEVELKELQSQQEDVIGGYQLVTENYEKLQQEFEDYKNGVLSEETNESSQLKEELDMFKEQLIAKDEDLTEIESRYENLQESFTANEVELENLRKELLKIQENDAKALSLEKVDKSVETDLEETRDVPIQVESTIQLFQSNESLRHSKECEEQFSSIKKLKDQCVEKLQVAKIQYHLREECLKKEIESLSVKNLELTAAVQSQERELSEKGLEMEQLLSSIQQYQQSIEKKTSEINEIIINKDDEIQKMMEAYKTYHDSKESLVVELNSVIEEKTQVIRSLEIEIQKQNQLQNENNHRVKEEMKKFEATMSSIEYAHQTEVSNMKSQLEKFEKELSRYQIEERKLLLKIQELESILGNHESEKAEMRLKLEKLTRLSAHNEDVEVELSRMRAEQARMAKLLEITEQKAREEYEYKAREGEVLHESESLAYQQQINTLSDELKTLSASLTKANEIMGKLKIENEKIQCEASAVKAEKESLLVDYNLQMNTIKRQEESILRLDAESEKLKQEVKSLESALKDQEAYSAGAKEDLETKAQETVLQAKENSQYFKKIAELEEEVRTLNDECIRKETKIELLHSKILEIETSEIKAFEESFMLKNWVRQMELDNLRYQEEINLLTNAGDGQNPKIQKLQDETMRLIYALDERDRRCVQLTLEITRLLEERDELQLKLSNVLKHTVEITATMKTEGNVSRDAPMYDKEDLQKKLMQLEDTNFRMHIDLRREREARKLVQQELLNSQATRIYRDRKIQFKNYNPPAVIHSKSPSSPSHSNQDSPVLPEKQEHSQSHTPKEGKEMVHI